MNDHLRLVGETMPQFAAGVKALTAKDREELTAQFEKEFDYMVTKSPIVERGAA